MSKRGLAYRRHQYERAKARARRRLRLWSNFSSNGTAWTEWDERAVGMLANTRVLCSCHMCGNPRRYFNEPTLQERKHRV